MHPSTQALITHYPELLDFLARCTGSRHIAQDCAQDTYLKLACAIAPAPLQSAKAYVFRVAANIAIDWHRQQQCECRLACDYARLCETLRAEDVTDLICARQTMQRLETAIEAMPLRTQHIFFMHRLEGSSYREIALSLSISVKAVEKHMTRMLATCRTVLRDEQLFTQ
ncbi:RNA polymerase sigma factor [Herbaspirillum sp. RTI4]|uniref:RNA polymerase sigma factor n=1 Tax=Herbaspirillum sp. RTI4 TaxID=3048640 RepID=UPI002AB4D962|nr:RNA polymerase sigma factor [Herbaspirillum sp. RTI4]MDY7577894.1 RNA polymerase sigma factor [Herbaspirillum sp. RTI4]MEA9981660.1 RNA polymerase sigma factor [Herbaspirillum sp. RTI4]